MVRIAKVMIVLLRLQTGGLALDSSNIAIKGRVERRQATEGVMRTATPSDSMKVESTASGTLGAALEKASKALQPTLPPNAGSQAKAAEKMLESAVKLENEEANKAVLESAYMVTELLKKAEDTVKEAKNKILSRTGSATREIEQSKKRADEQIATVVNGATKEVKNINNQARDAVLEITTSKTQEQMVQAMNAVDKMTQAAEDAAASFLKTMRNLQYDMDGVIERTNHVIDQTSEAVASERAAVDARLSAMAKQSLDDGQTIDAKLSVKELSELIGTRTTQAAENISALARELDADADTIIANFMASSRDKVSQTKDDVVGAKQRLEVLSKELSEAARESINQRRSADAQWMQAEATAIGKLQAFNDHAVDNVSNAESDETAAGLSAQNRFTNLNAGVLTFIILAIFVGVYMSFAQKSRMP